MTHKLKGDIVYLDPSGRDDSNRRRAMRAIVVSSAGLLITSAFEISIIVVSRHSRLDAIASAGALAGLIGVALGLRVADPIAGLAITALIVHIGIDATRDVASRLMDANDDELTEAVRAAAMAAPSVVKV